MRITATANDFRVQLIDNAGDTIAEVSAASLSYDIDFDRLAAAIAEMTDALAEQAS